MKLHATNECEWCEGSGKCSFCPDIGKCMECLAPGTCWNCAGRGTRHEEEEAEVIPLFDKDAGRLDRIEKFLGGKLEGADELRKIDPGGHRGYHNWAIVHALHYAKPYADDESTPMGTRVFAGPYVGELVGSPPGSWKIKLDDGKVLTPYGPVKNEPSHITKPLRPRLMEPTEQSVSDARQQFTKAVELLTLWDKYGREYDLTDWSPDFADQKAQLKDLSYADVEYINSQAIKKKPRPEFAKKEELPLEETEGTLVRYDTQDALCLDYPQNPPSNLKGREGWCTTWWGADHWGNYKEKGYDLYVLEHHGKPYHIAYNPYASRIVEIKDENNLDVAKDILDLAASALTEVTGDEIKTMSGKLYDAIFEDYHREDYEDMEDIQHDVQAEFARWVSHPVFANNEQLAVDFRHHIGIEPEAAALWAGENVVPENAAHWGGIGSGTISSLDVDDVRAICKWARSGAMDIARTKAWYSVIDDPDEFGGPALELALRWSEKGNQEESAKLAKTIIDAEVDAEVIKAWDHLNEAAAGVLRGEANPWRPTPASKMTEVILRAFYGDLPEEYEGDLVKDITFIQDMYHDPLYWDIVYGTATAVKHKTLTPENLEAWKTAPIDSTEGLSWSWVDWASSGVKLEHLESWQSIVETLSSADVFTGTQMDVVKDYALGDWEPEEARPWIERRFSAKHALDWLISGFTPDEADEWTEAGWKYPHEAKRQRNQNMTKDITTSGWINAADNIRRLYGLDTFEEGAEIYNRFDPDKTDPSRGSSSSRSSPFALLNSYPADIKYVDVAEEALRRFGFDDAQFIGAFIKDSLSLPSGFLDEYAKLHKVPLHDWDHMRPSWVAELGSIDVKRQLMPLINYGVYEKELEEGNTPEEILEKAKGIVDREANTLSASVKKIASKGKEMLKILTVGEIAEESRMNRELANRVMEKGTLSRSEMNAILGDITEYSKRLNAELTRRTNELEFHKVKEEGSKQVRLGDVAEVRQQGSYDADFWLQRRGNDKSIGKLRDDTWAKYDFGVKMRRGYEDLLPSVKHQLSHLFNTGYWRPYLHGTLALKNVRMRDIKDAPIDIPAHHEIKTAAIHIASDESDRENRLNAASDGWLERLSDIDSDPFLPADRRARVPYSGEDEVTIYRSVPEDVESIRPGDWVALEEAHTPSREKVLSQTVPADHVFWAGTDENEWFYCPVDGARKEAAITKNLPSHVTAYHCGRDIGDGPFSLDHLGSGEGWKGVMPLGPAIYFATNKNIAMRYCKYSDESYLYEVSIPTSGLYNSTWGTPIDLKDRLREAVVDAEDLTGKKIKHSMGGTKDLFSLLGNDAHEFLRDAGCTGSWTNLAAGGEEIGVYDPSIIEIVNKEPITSKKEAATIIPEMGDVIAAIDMSKDMVMSANDWNEFVDALSPVRYALQKQNVHFYLQREFDAPHFLFPRQFVVGGAVQTRHSGGSQKPIDYFMALTVYLPHKDNLAWSVMRDELIARIGHELIHVKQKELSGGMSRSPHPHKRDIYGPLTRKEDKKKTKQDLDYTRNPQEFGAKAWNIAQELASLTPSVFYHSFSEIPWKLSDEYELQYAEKHGDEKFLKKLKRKVVDILQDMENKKTEQTQREWAEQDALGKTAGKETLPVNTILYHGTVEELVGEGIRQSVDGLAWFAESPSVSKSYIPTAGMRMRVSLSKSDYPIRPDRDNKELIEQFFPEIVWEIEYYENNPHSVRSWGAKDSEGNYVEPPTSPQLIEKLEALGYEDDPDNSGIRWSPKYGLLLGNGWEVMPADWQEQGQLISIRVRQPISLYDMTEDEGDLMNPQHLEIDKFNKLQEAGYDGVRINDFLQHKEWGNVGHESVGLFASGLAKIDYHDIEPATHPSSEELMGRKATASATLEAMYNEIYERAKAAGASDIGGGKLLISGLLIRPPKEALEEYLNRGSEGEVRAYFIEELEPAIMEFELGADERLKQNEHDLMETRLEGQAHEVERVEDLPEAGPVWAWHGTSTALLARIKSEGLDPRFSGSTWQGQQEGVYLSLTGDVSVYTRRAVAQHGGEPVILRVLVDSADLIPDPDDSDISSGQWQVLHMGSIPPGSIWQIDDRWVKTAAGEIVERKLDELAGSDIGKRRQLEDAAMELYSEGLEDMEVADALGRRRERTRLEQTPNFPGAEFIEEFGDYLVYRIDTYEAAKRLGTRNWCIVRDEKIWDHYQEHDLTFWYHIDKEEGPPAKYVVGEMQKDGMSGFEVYSDQDEMQIESVEDVSESHEERGSTDMGVAFYEMLLAAIDGDPLAQKRLLMRPGPEHEGMAATTDYVVRKLLKEKRLPPEYLVELADGFAENMDELSYSYGHHTDTKTITDWFESAGQDFPNELEEALHRFASIKVAAPIDTMKTKYPNHLDELDKLIESDPTGRRRYIDWQMRQVVRDVRLEELIPLTWHYHRLSKHIGGNIDAFPDVDSLSKAVDAQMKKAVPRTTTEDTVEDSKLPEPAYVTHPPRGTTYRGLSGDYDVFDISSHSGSVALGTNKWCIVRGQKTWDDYAKRDIKFRYLVNREKGLPAEYALAIHLDGKLTEVYGPNDEIIVRPPEAAKEHGEGEMAADELDSKVRRALDPDLVIMDPASSSGEVPLEKGIGSHLTTDSRWIYALAKAYDADTFISIADRAHEHAKDGDPGYSSEPGFYKAYAETILKGNQRLKRKFDSWTRMRYGVPMQKMYRLSKLGLTPEWVEDYKAKGITSLRAMSKLVKQRVTPFEVRDALDVWIEEGLGTRDALKLRDVNRRSGQSSFTVETYREYVDLGITDIDQIVALASPFGRNRLMITPEHVRGFKANGVDSVERMLEVRKELARGSIGAHAWYQDDVERLLRAVEELEDQKRRKELEAEHQRLMPKLNEAWEKLPEGEEKERIADLDASFFNRYSYFIHGSQGEGSKEAAEFVAWARTIVPGAFPSFMTKEAAGQSYNLLRGLTEASADYDSPPSDQPEEGAEGPWEESLPVEPIKKRKDDHYIDREVDPAIRQKFTYENIGYGKGPEGIGEGDMTGYSPASETVEPGEGAIVRSGEVVDSIKLILGLVPEDVEWKKSPLRTSLEFLQLEPEDIGDWVENKDLRDTVVKEMEEDEGLEMLGLGLIEFGVADNIKIDDGSLVLWRHV